jgi:hypothetical protein
MSFQRLATVELQLILHCLDVRSFLLIARCCRFSMAAAYQSFARRHLPSVRCTPVNIPRHSRPLNIRHDGLICCIMRQVGVHLDLTVCYQATSIHQQAESVLAVMLFVRSMTLRGRGVFTPVPMRNQATGAFIDCMKLYSVTPRLRSLHLVDYPCCEAKYFRHLQFLVSSCTALCEFSMSGCDVSSLR